VVLIDGVKQGKGGMWLITDILPKAQVEAPQFQVHISHLLQKCKKDKFPEKEFALFKNDITTN
jgi:hypothetical protein